MTSCKGQVEITFNWIYILIAGTVILLFFVGLVVKGQSKAEEQLAQDVVHIMKTIFTGAGVSEKTKNFIDVSGLSDYTLQFSCEEGVSSFSFAGQTVQDNTQPIFAPKKIRTTRLILWSLPYKLPYKAVDLLYVTSVNTKYYLVGNDVDFINEFVNATYDPDPFLRLNGEYILNLDHLNERKKDTSNFFQIRIIDVDGKNIKENAAVPLPLKNSEDSLITAVSFIGKDQVIYYQKKGSIWKKLNNQPLLLTTLGGERDAARYAAIFAADAETYTCNMHKAFKRLLYVNNVYAGLQIGEGIPGGKLGDILSYYTNNSQLSFTKPDCFGYSGVEGKAYPPNLREELTVFHNKINSCLLEPKICPDLVPSAFAIRNINDKLKIECLTLY